MSYFAIEATAIHSHRTKTKLAAMGNEAFGAWVLLATYVRAHGSERGELDFLSIANLSVITNIKSQVKLRGITARLVAQRWLEIDYDNHKLKIPKFLKYQRACGLAPKAGQQPLIELPKPDTKTNSAYAKDDIQIAHRTDFYVWLNSYPPFPPHRKNFPLLVKEWNRQMELGAQLPEIMEGTRLYAKSVEADIIEKGRGQIRYTKSPLNFLRLALWEDWIKTENEVSRKESPTGADAWLAGEKAKEVCDAKRAVPLNHQGA